MGTADNSLAHAFELAATMAEAAPLERSDSNPKATRKVYYRRGDVSRGKTQALGLETLVESNQAKMIVIQFPDADEENPEDDMYKFKRWQIHFMPADHCAGPFKDCLIRVEC